MVRNPTPQDFAAAGSPSRTPVAAAAPTYRAAKGISQRSCPDPWMRAAKAAKAASVKGGRKSRMSSTKCPGIRRDGEPIPHTVATAAQTYVVAKGLTQRSSGNRLKS